MGRPRKRNIPSEPLPEGLWKHGRIFRAKRPSDRSYTYFGTDYVSAVPAYAAWRNADRGDVHSVEWLLNLCAGHVWPARVKAGKMAKRTLRDHRRDKAILIAGLGKCPLKLLRPSHIASFRDTRQVDAPCHVRNESGVPLLGPCLCSGARLRPGQSGAASKAADQASARTPNRGWRVPDDLQPSTTLAAARNDYDYGSPRFRILQWK